MKKQYRLIKHAMIKALAKEVNAPVKQVLKALEIIRKEKAKL